MEQEYDIADEARQQLMSVIPEAFADGKILWEKLRESLGDMLDDDDETAFEHYGLNWPGKRNAKKIAATSSTLTLTPLKGEGINEDTTENIFIEGDNLEVLKILYKSYKEKIKMIYIDPPYNTGNDFVYNDDFRMTEEEFMRAEGSIDEQGNRLVSNKKTSGRFHANWLNMMYPRLKIARELLKDDGVIFIHISRQEVNNLTQLCDELFGEANQLGIAIWDKGNPKGDANSLAYQHEYIVMYTKNMDQFKKNNLFERSKKNAKAMLSKANQLYKKIGKKIINDDLKKCVKEYQLDIDTKFFEIEYTLDTANDEFQQWLLKQDFSNGEKAYKFIDKNGYLFQSVSMAWPNKKKAPDEYFIPLIHPITKQPCSVPDKGWRNPVSTMKKLFEENLILFGNDHTTQPRRKYLLHENMEENIPSILFYGGSDDELMKEFQLDFENPKPYLFSKELISYICKNDDIVMDFFAGSGTTAHAVMELNKDDGGNRKYICVQIQEPINQKENKQAFDFCTNILRKPPVISELTKERIRKASKKIQSNNHDFQGDLGFKVYKTIRSNHKKWGKYSITTPKEADNLFATHQHSLIDDWEYDSVMTEILLAEGFALTSKIKTFDSVNTNQIVRISDPEKEYVLYVCLDEHINPDTIKALNMNDNDIFICLGSAIDDQNLSALHDKGRIRTL